MFKLMFVIISLIFLVPTQVLAFYFPEAGRFITRDPIGEKGGVNLTAFVENNPINSWDYLGLDGVVIAGGSSVNDPEGHDKSPWNFLNSAARRAKELKAQYVKEGDNDSKVFLVMYAPSYERRAISEKRPTKDYYLNIMKNSAQKLQFELILIKSKNELTAHLNKFKKQQLTSVDYFGHSNRESMFLEYSSVQPGVSTDYWGEKEAQMVNKDIFSPVAVYASYGCYQGKKGGLAEKIRDIWGVVSKGSRGKTDYIPIGQGHTYPTSEDGFIEYK